MVNSFIAYAKAGKEFETAEAMQDHGIDATAPRQIIATSRGKSRAAKIEDQPYLPNYIFWRGSDHQYHNLRRKAGMGELKHLRPYHMQIPAQLSQHVTNFLEGIEAEAQRVISRYKAGEAVQQYKPGQLVRVIEKGHVFAEWLEHQTATFQSMVEAAHMPHPMARLSVDIMGRNVSVDVDPLYIRGA